MNDLDLCLEVKHVNHIALITRHVALKGHTFDPNTLRANISKTAGDRDSFQRTTSRKWHMGYQMVT